MNETLPPFAGAAGAAGPSPEVRARIVSAADRLYAEAGRDKFPPVDVVRREARADMHTVSAVMREWRRAQTAPVAEPVTAIPARVVQAANAAAGAAWSEAQALASEALASARREWEAERKGLDADRAELADIVDQRDGALAQAGADLDAQTLRVGELEQWHEALAKRLEDAQRLAERLQEGAQRDEAAMGVLRAESAVIEGERDALRVEAATARTAADERWNLVETLRGEIQAARDQAQKDGAEISRLAAAAQGDRAEREKLEHINSKMGLALDGAKADLEKMATDLKEARAKTLEAAVAGGRLEGEVAALRRQVADLLRVIQAQPGEAGSAVPAVSRVSVAPARGSAEGFDLVPSPAPEKKAGRSKKA